MLAELSIKEADSVPSDERTDEVYRVRGRNFACQVVDQAWFISRVDKEVGCRERDEWLRNGCLRDHPLEVRQVLHETEFDRGNSEVVAWVGTVLAGLLKECNQQRINSARLL
jgi:hypothetical protein